MPPNSNKGSGLKRLQDLPDTSVSFQIPADSSSAEFLLADTSDLDFLRGAGSASFATVAPTPARGRLKLRDVTRTVDSPEAVLPVSPRRSPSPVLSIQWGNGLEPSRFSHQSPVKANKTTRIPSRLKEVAFDEPTISEERLESLRAEVKTLQADYDIAMHTEPPIIAQCPVMSIPNNTSASGSTMKLRSTRANPTAEGSRNVKDALRSRIHRSADGKPSTAEPAAQSSSSWSIPGSTVIDTELQVPPAGVNIDNIATSDTSQNVRLSTGGMADRLVSYSHKLMSSIGIYNPKSENSFATDIGAVVAKSDVHFETQSSSTVHVAHTQSSSVVSNGNNCQLRLSDISPQKHEAEISSPGDLSTVRRELSPMRPPSKRPAIDGPSQQHGGSKKGKQLSQSAEAKRSRSMLASSHSQVLQPSTRKNHAHASAPVSRWPTSNFPSARTKYKPKLTSHNNRPSRPSVSRLSISHGTKTINKEKGKCDVGLKAVSTGAPLLSQSRVSGTSRVMEKTPMILERSGPSRVCLVSQTLEKTTAITLPPANLTKPVAFTFRVASRIEARKEEKLVASEQGPAATSMHQQRHHIPNFKVLHEARPVSLACRKHAPIIPAAPIMLHTEIRAKEREKFDEMMRMKEEDMEREKEERRRQREAEEEREIKELRKRAIPKANEVPDWYADMPKKGGGVRGSG